MKRPNTPRQRRVGAAISGVFGIVLIVMGFVVAIPYINLYYGIFWIIMAACITGLNFYHAFSRNDKHPEFSRSGQYDLPREMTEQAASAAAVTTTPQMVPPGPSTGSGIDQERQAQLAQLDRLLESGMLTREEYRQRKDKLNFK